MRQISTKKGERRGKPPFSRFSVERSPKYRIEIWSKIAVSPSNSAERQDSRRVETSGPPRRRHPGPVALRGGPALYLFTAEPSRRSALRRASRGSSFGCRSPWYSSKHRAHALGQKPFIKFAKLDLLRIKIRKSKILRNFSQCVVFSRRVGRSVASP